MFITIGAFSLTRKGWWKASVSSFSLISSSFDETEDSSPRASFFDRCLQKSVNSSTDLPVKLNLYLFLLYFLLGAYSKINMKLKCNNNLLKLKKFP